MTQNPSVEKACAGKPGHAFSSQTLGASGDVIESKMSNVPLATARLFAAALDAEDYRALADLLADECRYVTSKGTFDGPQAIVASYRAASMWAKSRIRHVQYESTVRSCHETSAVVTFIDRLEHDGLTHEYACEQEVVVDAQGRVCRIVHQELPGQREAVELFLGSIGVRI